MTKLTSNRIDAFIRKPDPGIRAVLVYGQDEGMVRERAAAIGKTVVKDLADPFCVSDVAAEAAAKHTGLLAEEMAAISMMGGRRLVRLRSDAEDALAAISAALQSPPPGGSMLLVEAGDIGNKSKLCSLFEKSEIAVAIPCYKDDEASFTRAVAGLLAEHGLSASSDAREYLTLHLAGDRAMARSEIAKLALYMGKQKKVELGDAKACIGIGGDYDISDPVWAAADGNAEELDRALENLLSRGESPIALLRVAQKHFERLYRVASLVKNGESITAAVASLKPPVFFKEQQRFTAQARNWKLPQLQNIIAKLLEAEAECKKTGMPDTLMCSRVFHQIAAIRKSGVINRKS